MTKFIEKRPVLFIIVFVLLTLAFSVDVLPVSIMEARNFITAREMLSDNNWLLTTMNGQPRYEKPPLPTWITAMFGYLFGMGHVLALRFPALLMLSAVGIFAYRLSLDLELHRSHSLINGLVAVSSFYVMAIIIEAPWDIYAHGFMLMALFFAYRFLSKAQISLKNGLLFAVFVAASVLSKGPVSLYALLLSFLISYGIAFGYRQKKANFLRLLGLFLLGLILGASWYLYVRFADPDSFTRIAQKETSNWSSYNVRPFYYYWSFFAQSGLWTLPALMALLYPFMKNRVAQFKAYRFTFLWTLIAVILLSLIPEKKSRYLMPVLIPLALNTGFYLHYMIQKGKDSSLKERMALYITFGLVGLLACALWLIPWLAGTELEGTRLIRYILGSVVSMVLGIALFRFLISWRVKRLFYGTLVFVICLGLLVLPLLPLGTTARQTRLKQLQNMDLPLYSMGSIAPELIYAYGEKIPSIHPKGKVQLPEEEQWILICNKAEQKELNNLKEQFKVEYVGELDFNAFEKGERNYRKRLTNSLYKLTTN